MLVQIVLHCNKALWIMIIDKVLLFFIDASGKSWFLTCQNFCVKCTKNFCLYTTCRHLLYPGRIRTRVSQGRPKMDIKIDVHMWFSVLCMFNIHKCIIHHINQNFSADAKMYHTCVYVEHTWSYDHICTWFWRSFSGSAAIINLPLKILDTEW